MPVHFGSATVGFDRPAPAFSQHNDDVYGGLLGYTSERIAQLRASGVI